MKWDTYYLLLIIIYFSQLTNNIINFAQVIGYLYHALSLNLNANYDLRNCQINYYKKQNFKSPWPGVSSKSKCLRQHKIQQVKVKHKKPKAVLKSTTKYHKTPKPPTMIIRLDDGLRSTHKVMQVMSKYQIHNYSNKCSIHSKQHHSSSQIA